MKRFVIGVAIASVVLYAWGFVYWGLGPYQTLIWKQAGNDAAAGKALLRHFPENGVYFVPAARPDAAETTRLYESGPLAFVYMLSNTGGSPADPAVMAGGFLLNLAVIVLIGLLLVQAGSALPTYFDRVKFTALAGLTSAVLIDFGAVVWWRMSLPWKLYQAIYDVSAWVIAGLVLAYFVAPRPQRVQEETMPG